MDHPSNTESIRLVCREIWGGNRRAFQDVQLPGLEGVVCALPCQGDRGGDLYYFGACGSGVMGRVCLADIAGHGEAVAGLGVWLHRVFRSHVHRISPAGVLYAVNAHVHRKGYDAISTAVVLSYNSRNGKLRYAYAGHPRGLHYRRREGRWVFLNPPEHPARDVRNVPFGVAADTRYDVGLAGLRPGDRILFYSDGVTEVADSSGRRLGDKGLMGLLDGLEDAPPREAGEALLRALQGFAGRDDFQHDDVTFLLLDGGPFQRRSRLNLLVRNNLRKLLRGPKP